MARLPLPQRVVLVLLLAVVLAAPAVLGAQPRPRAEDQSSGFITELVSELRVQVWSLLSGFWEKNGCIIDPHGGCTQGTTDRVDEGCRLAPHGVCTADHGGTTDTTVQGDAGCGIDPHGGCGH